MGRSTYPKLDCLYIENDGNFYFLLKLEVISNNRRFCYINYEIVFINDEGKGMKDHKDDKNKNMHNMKTRYI